MIRINLLPVREWRKREQLRKEISLFFLSLALVATILLAVGVIIQGRLISQRAQVRNLEGRKAQLAHVNKEIAEADRKKQEIENKFTAIEELQAERMKTVKVLDEIAQAVPADRLWITELSLKNQDFRVTGVAMDNHTVALFMNRLGSSELIGPVNLASVKRQAVEGQDLMGFEVTGGVKRPSAPEDTTKAPKKDTKG